MKKTLAVLGIVFVLVGTYLVYISSQTKGTPGTYGGPGPNPTQVHYARIGAIGYVLIVFGSLMGIPFLLSTP